MLKVKLKEAGIDVLKGKLHQIERDLQELSKAAASDTKSSMGDKYETSREMITQETNKLSTLEAQNASQLSFLQNLDTEKAYTQIESGAYFETTLGKFFVSVPLGQVKVDGTPVFYLSPLAPLAQAALGLTAGEEFAVNNRKQKITLIS